MYQYGTAYHKPVFGTEDDDQSSFHHHRTSLGSSTLNSLGLPHLPLEIRHHEWMHVKHNSPSASSFLFNNPLHHHSAAFYNQFHSSSFSFNTVSKHINWLCHHQQQIPPLPVIQPPSSSSLPPWSISPYSSSSGMYGVASTLVNK